MKKYIVHLSKPEKTQLTRLVKTGKAAAFKHRRAQILLLADVNRAEGGCQDKEIAALLNVSTRTIQRTRQRLVEQGFDKVLEREPPKARLGGLDGEQEAWIVALCSTAPPTGHNQWTLALLRGRMVALGQVDSITRETIRQVLKKHNKNLVTWGIVYSSEPER